MITLDEKKHGNSIPWEVISIGMAYDLFGQWDNRKFSALKYLENTFFSLKGTQENEFLFWYSILLYEAICLVQSFYDHEQTGLRTGALREKERQSRNTRGPWILNLVKCQTQTTSWLLFKWSSKPIYCPLYFEIGLSFYFAKRSS